MSSVNSIQKIEVLTGISGASTSFAVNCAEGMARLKVATEVIAVPAFDVLYNGLVGVMTKANVLITDLSESTSKLAKTWGERPGFGEAARQDFEECEKVCKNVAGMTFAAVEVELSDGKHETINDETIGAFTKALALVVGAKDPFIMKIGEVVSEGATSDTSSVFNTLGQGIESFTNSMVDVLEANKASIAVFGVNLDESIGETKRTAITAAANAKTIARSVSQGENGLS